jgi:hypothetical protein
MARIDDIAAGLLVSGFLAGLMGAGGPVAAGGLVVGHASQSCQLVSGPKLEEFYPVMPGWERSTPVTEDDVDGVTRTTADFDRGESTISVELMDTCRGEDLLLLMRETLKELPPGGSGTTQRHTKVNNFPAYEEFTAESGHGEIHVLVAERFLVKVTADSSDLPTLQNAARLIRMKDLAAIR